MTSTSSVVDEVVVEQLVVEVLLDHVLVEVFLVELGLVLELVVAHVLGALLRRRNVRLPTNPGTCEMLPVGAFRATRSPSGARSITPRASMPVHPPYRPTQARDGREPGSDGRVQETGGAAGWPDLHTADGLSQRSLLSLLDSRRTPCVAPPPRGAGVAHGRRPWDAGGVGVVRLSTAIPVKP